MHELIKFFIREIQFIFRKNSTIFQNFICFLLVLDFDHNATKMIQIKTFYKRDQFNIVDDEKSIKHDKVNKYDTLCFTKRKLKKLKNDKMINK